MKSPFNVRASVALADDHLQRALETATGRFGDLRRKGFESTPAPLALRAKAQEIRRRTFEELDRHLDALIRSLERAGGRVHFAPDAAAATRIVLEIAERNGVKTAVKSKSMATEEIHLNRALEQAGITPVETDLGEWILQLAEDTPSHLIAPAIHLTRQQVAELFTEKVDPAVGRTPEELVAAARAKLRAEFLKAGMGISGVNFAVAETGTLCIVTNEGNGRLVTTLPRVHVAVMGFEKVVPTLEEMLTLLAVLPRSATGQKISTYFTMLTGPRRRGEADGPEEMHVVILDGGRSRHLGGPFQEAFHCIRCAACLNACPVYQKVGGHTYDSVYGGPIGSLLSPMLRGVEVAGELPAASSLCGACLEACPVLVDIPRMLIEMRASRVEQKSVSRSERLAFRAAAYLMQRPALWDFALWAAPWLLWPFSQTGKMNWLPGPFRGWRGGRELPLPARKRFRAGWRERKRAGAAAPPAAEPPPGGNEAPAARAVERARRALALGHGLAHAPAEAPAGPLPEVEVPDAAERFRVELEMVDGTAYRPASEKAARQIVLEIVRQWEGFPVAVSEDLPLPVSEWLSEEGVETLPPEADGDDRDRLSRAGLGVTACTWAIAETGTLVLCSGGGRPRLHSLLPEVHLALVPEDRIVPHLSSLKVPLGKTLRGPKGTRPSCVNFITGPSRSADIELTLTKGAHGPREVHAIILPAAGFDPPAGKRPARRRPARRRPAGQPKRKKSPRRP